VSLVWLTLRAGEVASLSLDDADWRRGEITVRGKVTGMSGCRFRPTSGMRSCPTWTQAAQPQLRRAGRCS
jgi:hypothetical protein